MGKGFVNVRDAARGHWVGILRALGFHEKLLSGQHGPCLFECGGDFGGKDRARFTNYEENGVYRCNVCGSVDGIGLVMKFYNWDYKKTCKEVLKIIKGVLPMEENTKPDPSVRLREIEKGLIKVEHNDPVWLYLTGRGLKYIPPTLRHHPSLPYYEKQDGGGKPRLIGRYSAMVAKVTAWDGKPCTFHVTYLTKDGKKLNVKNPKKTLPHMGNIEGSAIRLFKLTGDRLAVCEGIETAIAVYELLEKKVPVWPCRDANSLANFRLPAGSDVRKLSIYGDNDPKYAGQCAAYMLAAASCKGNVVVDVHIPSNVGRDFLDEKLGAVA